MQKLGQEIGDNDPVVLRAELLLRSLRDTLDKSVLLAKVSGLQATYLLAFEPTHPLRFLIKVGENVRSLYSASGGKAILGALDDAALDTVLRNATLKQLTERTITSKAALREDIVRSRTRGWYLNQGETIESVTTLSAPFRWNAARYIVTIAGPSARLDPKLSKPPG